MYNIFCRNPDNIHVLSPYLHCLSHNQICVGVFGMSFLSIPTHFELSKIVQTYNC